MVSRSLVWLMSMLLILPLIQSSGAINALAVPGSDSSDRPNQPHTPDLRPSHPNMPHGKGISPPPSGQTQVASLNWAGYAVSQSIGSVTDVKGSWNVPTLSCSTKTTYAAFWDGIDGYSSSSVEQTGVLAECYHGHAYYYTWYEFYPASPVYVTNQVPVKAGDIIYGEVSYNSGSDSFTVTLTDQTTGATFTTTQPNNGYSRSSAEWIAEAPASGGSILPLANFGTVKYGLDYTSVSSTNDATINGISGTIGSFGSSLVQLIMTTMGGTIKALPSGLTTDGTSFTVAWKHS